MEKMGKLTIALGFFGACGLAIGSGVYITVMNILSVF